MGKDKVYKLRLSDFIPFVGIIEYHKRCLDEMIWADYPSQLDKANIQIDGTSNIPELKEEYRKKTALEDTVLTFWNAVVSGGIGVGLYELADLLF